MRSVTLADVAKKAGVSIQTVSRVINGQAETSDATRKRVMQAIIEVDYRPNSVARGLRNKETFSVGVVVPKITNPFFPEIIQGIELAAAKAGYAVILSSSDEHVERETELVRVLDARRVDGIILCSPRQSEASLRAGLSRYSAAVLINRSLEHEKVGIIKVNYAMGARIALEYLVRLGRKNIVLAAIPETSYGGHERREGFLAGAMAHGFGDLQRAVYYGMPTVEGGTQTTTALLRDQPDVDGIVYYNDLTAAGGLLALRKADRKVPTDVAIIGCDDIPFAALFSPRLTTLNIDKQAIGIRAMEMLMRRMKGEVDEPEVIFEPELVIRETA
jgi:LacI family transcriptional regulator